MASAAGEIFDSHGGDALAIAEQLVQARAELVATEAALRRATDTRPVTAEAFDRRGAELEIQRALLAELRARDEAAKAVVRAWQELRDDIDRLRMAAGEDFRIPVEQLIDEVAGMFGIQQRAGEFDDHRNPEVRHVVRYILTAEDGGTDR
jgi:DNA repair exonuclease SbcCD ATPase subunit